jgi:hypothetical protein
MSSRHGTRVERRGCVPKTVAGHRGRTRGYTDEPSAADEQKPASTEKNGTSAQRPALFALIAYAQVMRQI